MRWFIAVLLAVSACTSAGEAEEGTRRLLNKLDIKIVAMACMGTQDAAGSNQAVCNVKTEDGDILVSHCDFVWPAAGCTIIRPGASQ